jgi:hypothetical protein
MGSAMWGPVGGLTWPREAAATGWEEKLVKRVVSGAPSCRDEARCGEIRGEMREVRWNEARCGEMR